MTKSISKFYSIIFALLVMLGAFSLSLPGGRHRHGDGLHSRHL